MKMLITGRSGVGKSTILNELQKRGYLTYDTDDMPEVSRLEIRSTGEPADWPEGYVDWDTYAWRWQKPALEKLLHTDKDVIIAAIMANQTDFYHLFDRVILLTTSSTEIRNRLENRNAHTFGQSQANIERAVERHDKKQLELLVGDVIAIESTRPIYDVVNDICLVINKERDMNE